MLLPPICGNLPAGRSFRLSINCSCSWFRDSIYKTGKKIYRIWETQYSNVCRRGGSRGEIWANRSRTRVPCKLIFLIARSFRDTWSLAQKEKFRSALIRKPVRIHASPLLNAFRFIVSRAMRRDRGGGRKVSKIARFYFEIPRGTTLVSCRMLNTIKERNEMTRFSFRFLLVSLLIIADSLCSWNFNRCFSWDIV